MAWRCTAARPRVSWRLFPPTGREAVGGQGPKGMGAQWPWCLLPRVDRRSLCAGGASPVHGRWRNMVQKTLGQAAWNSIFYCGSFPLRFLLARWWTKVPKHWCARAVAYSKWISRKPFQQHVSREGSLRVASATVSPVSFRFRFSQAGKCLDTLLG